MNCCARVEMMNARQILEMWTPRNWRHSLVMRLHHVPPARPMRLPNIGTTCKHEFKMAAPLLSLSSSEEDEITARPPPKVSKKVYKQCYMHLTSVKKEEKKEFTRTRWDTFRNSIKQWFGLQGESQRIAETYKHCLEIEFDNIPEDAGFHSTCYRRFIDKKRPRNRSHGVLKLEMLTKASLCYRVVVPRQLIVPKRNLGPVRACQ